jgi:hypothetical protein
LPLAGFHVAISLARLIRYFGVGYFGGEHGMRCPSFAAKLGVVVSIAFVAAS